MYNAMIIDAKDNVAVAIEQIAKGDTISWKNKEGEECTLEALTDVQIYHKFATKEIKEGEPVIKYGEHIGLAACGIHPGQHVHTHNVKDHRENL